MFKSHITHPYYLARTLHLHNLNTCLFIEQEHEAVGGFFQTFHFFSFLFVSLIHVRMPRDALTILSRRNVDFALLCFASLCFALLYFTLLCFALLRLASLRLITFRFVCFLSTRARSCAPLDFLSGASHSCEDTQRYYTYRSKGKTQSHALGERHSSSNYKRKFDFKCKKKSSPTNVHFTLFKYNRAFFYILK